MKKWLLALITLLLLGGLISRQIVQRRGELSAQSGMRKSRTGMPASVELAPIKYRDITTTFTATGSVESIQQVNISPRVSGRIDFVQVREGDRIRQGQMLVRIDPTDAQAEVRQQQANLAQAQARLAQARITKSTIAASVETQIRLQEANLAQAKSRLAQAQITQSTVDSSVTTQIRQQEANLAQAKSRLEQARLTQPTTDSAVETQIRQQEAALASMQADLRQAQATRDATLESVKASLQEAQSKIDNATALVANANAGINSAQANHENATARYTRILGLYKQGYVAAQDVDDAKTAMTVQQSAVETARGQLQAVTATLATVTAQKRSVEQQANISRARVDADVEAAQAKVNQARAALDNARANSAQSPAFQQNLAALQAAVDVAQTNVDSARANATQTPAYQQNLAALKSAVAVAQANLDFAKANAKQTPAYQENLEALKAAVAIAQASLDSAKAKLDDTVLRSPLDGVVTARTQDPGALASPSQAILTVQAMNKVWVTIAVPEDVVAKIHVNQSAQVTFDALGGRTLTAIIAQINPAADLQSRQYTVRVLLDNANHLLAAGMFGKVTLITNQVKHVLAVPREAVQSDRAGNSIVFIAVKGKKGITAVQRPVVTGPSDADFIALLSGVRAEEQVVTMSAMPLHDGQSLSSGRRRGNVGSKAPGGGTEGSKRSEAGNASGDMHRDGSDRAPGATPDGMRPASKDGLHPEEKASDTVQDDNLRLGVKRATPVDATPALRPDTADTAPADAGKAARPHRSRSHPAVGE